MPSSRSPTFACIRVNEDSTQGMTRWETYFVHHVTPFVPSRLRLEGVRGEERPILPLSPRTCRWSLGPHWGVVTSFGVRRITNFNK